MNREHRRDGRGSASVELVILAPLFGLLMLAVVAVGRVQIARADIDATARMAARELSIARYPGDRIPAVEDTVAATLRVGSPSCRTMALRTEIDDARVTVIIECSTELQHAAVLPLSGTLTVSGQAVEIRDVHREADQ